MTGFEYDAIKRNGIHGWVKRHRHCVIRIFVGSEHGWNLNGYPKTFPPCGGWCVKLVGYNANTSPADPALAAIFILACYCPDNRVLGYVVDTFDALLRTSDSKGMLMCARYIRW